MARKKKYGSLGNRNSEDQKIWLLRQPLLSGPNLVDGPVTLCHRPACGSQIMAAYATVFSGTSKYGSLGNRFFPDVATVPSEASGYGSPGERLFFSPGAIP